MKIAIISSSVRDGRKSHRVALFLRNYIGRMFSAEAEILDLKAYAFPIFHERIWNLREPSEGLLDYAERFNAADGIVIVTPVYNGSFPAALKNVIDVFLPEWKHKPCLVVSVSDGKTAGIATVQALQALLLKMEARVAGPPYTVINVPAEYGEDGTPANPEQADKYAEKPMKELVWMISKSVEPYLRSRL